MSGRRIGASRKFVNRDPEESTFRRVNSPASPSKNPTGSLPTDTVELSASPKISEEFQPQKLRPGSLWIGQAEGMIRQHQCEGLDTHAQNQQQNMRYPSRPFLNNCLGWNGHNDSVPVYESPRTRAGTGGATDQRGFQTFQKRKKGQDLLRPENTWPKPGIIDRIDL